MTDHPPDRPQGARILCLDQARPPHRPGRCTHARVAVDPDLAEVHCQDCHEKLNPVAVLYRLATEESRLVERIEALHEARERLARQRRCQCEHCGRTTRIRA